VAANQGQSVAVVEKGPLGGTCLNRGPIPSKLLLYHADVLETAERAGEFRIDVTVEEVGADAASIRRGLESSSQHDLFDGGGRFVGERTVEITGGRDDGARLRAETVLIAAGTRPAVPGIDGINDVEYLTSTGAFELETPPEHLVPVTTLPRRTRVLLGLPAVVGPQWRKQQSSSSQERRDTRTSVGS